MLLLLCGVQHWAGEPAASVAGSSPQTLQLTPDDFCPYVTFMTRALTGYGVSVLPVTFDDCAAYERLPFPDPQHRDPFDRMIIVHALRGGLAIVGVDVAFDAYGVTRLW